MVQFILVSYSYSYSILHQIYKQITIADIADKDEHSNVQKRKQYEQGNQSNKMEKWNWKESLETSWNKGQIRDVCSV